MVYLKHTSIIHLFIYYYQSSVRNNQEVCPNPAIVWGVGLMKVTCSGAEVCIVSWRHLPHKKGSGFSGNKKKKKTIRL